MLCSASNFSPPRELEYRAAAVVGAGDAAAATGTRVREERRGPYSLLRLCRRLPPPAAAADSDAVPAVLRIPAGSSNIVMTTLRNARRHAAPLQKHKLPCVRCVCDDACARQSKPTS